MQDLINDLNPGLLHDEGSDFIGSSNAWLNRASLDLMLLTQHDSCNDGYMITCRIM